MARHFASCGGVTRGRGEGRRTNTVCRGCIQFPCRPTHLSAIVGRNGDFICCCGRRLPTARGAGGVRLALSKRVLSESRMQARLPPSSAVACCVSDVIRFLSHAPHCEGGVVAQGSRIDLQTCIACGDKDAKFSRGAKGGGTRVSGIFRAVHKVGCAKRFLVSDVHVATASSPRNDSRVGLFLSERHTLRLGGCLTTHARSQRKISALFHPH